ncbi:MAG: hypothetical protein WCB11_08990 [Terriglobales bacterium]
MDCEHVFDRLLPMVERKIKDATDYRPAWLDEGPSLFDGGSRIEIPGIHDLVLKADVPT